MAVKIVNETCLLRHIKEHNKTWFSPANKRFSGDVSYKAYYGRVTGNRYLVRSTYAFTDMLGDPRKLHYRINPIGENYKILSLINDIFPDISAVKDWLTEH